MDESTKKVFEKRYDAISKLIYLDRHKLINKEEYNDIKTLIFSTFHDNIILGYEIVTQKYFETNEI